MGIMGGNRRTETTNEPRVTRAFRSASAGAVSLFALAGCIWPSFNAPSAEVRADPNRVLGIAEDVFRMYDIPVERPVVDSERLESGTFVRGPTWGGEAIERRVDCGMDDEGQPRPLHGEVTLIVELTARRRPVQTGFSMPVEGSRVEVDGRAQLEDGVRCQLTREFTSAIVCAVAARAGEVQRSGDCDGILRAGTRNGE